MPVERFFSDTSFTPENECILEGQEFHHLSHVIRCRAGEKVELVNGRNELAFATLVSIEKKKATLQIDTVVKKTPGKEIILAQAIPRFNRLEFILEKGTELGASAFWLFPGVWSEKSDFSNNQQERMELLTVSAMKQCSRLDLPPILIKPQLTEWALIPNTTILYGDTRPEAPPVTPPFKDPLILVVGPERGLSPQEVHHLDGTLKARGVCLNHNILRTDTAAMAFLAITALNIKPLA
ncbi:MAG: RsmE family RNA methyltransferase [Chlamydiota bacterium]